MVGRDMAIWTPEKKLSAAIEAPRALAVRRHDTRIIERPGWFQVATPSSPGTWRNEIIHSDVLEADAERVIDEVIATYHAMQKPVKWSVGPWTRPLDFGERLARRGFVSWNVVGMGMSTASTLASANEGVRVVEVEERQGLATYAECAQRAWESPLPEIEAEIDALAAAIAERTIRLYVVEVDGSPVGAAATVARGDYAYLLGAAVEPKGRGRGAYRALVAARLGDLFRSEIGYAVTHAREHTSAPILARLGFETLFRSQCWTLDPPQ
jgi:Acetyltransferase (GNAT) domain